ncbi:Bug family tripartite tricarboxylate transporter substrate binding protein [Variovorax sp. M-6]|uniref:Bug family tripartite tricarboxylate transporter substrate binding protein n=1 Tax=Variovorax sp. M-6 TaxID=3233041 RepID=UPI003F983EE7
MNRRHLVFGGLAGATLNALASSQAYPSKPVKLIVPYAPGGTTDLLARIVAAKLSTILGQPVVVDNRPGAGGSVGSAAAAKQPADGYTLVMVVESSHAVNPNVYAKSPYDPVKDFAAIGNIADVPNVLVTNPALGAESVQSLVKILKEQPGKFSYGSSGNGGLSHINGELFKHVTSTDMLHVPYKGLGPALSDLLAGQINVVFDNIPSSMELIQAKRVKPLAVAAKSRLKLLPQVPTYAETGLPAMNNPSWFGLGGPAGIPTEILDQLNRALNQALSDPGVISAIEKQGAVPSPTPRKEFASFVAAENLRWAKIVADLRFERM